MTDLGLLLDLQPEQPMLYLAGREVRLSDVISIQKGTLHFNRSILLHILNLPPYKSKQQSRRLLSSAAQHITPLNPDINSPEWRSQNARNAANARHNQPGGSREKQKKIRAIWATGKYTTRDICAEEECADLNMSFSAARKALITHVTQLRLNFA
ncbi:MAG: hypothetical protein GY782_03755 [Gammaproteobacteria bacterium]|nr:hypothetical protein [Gammaproteobacteria bacterium]